MENYCNSNKYRSYSCIICQHKKALEFQEQGLKNSRESILHLAPLEKASWYLVFHLKEAN